MSFLPLIIQLLSGAIGGNVVGALIKNLSLGTVGNSLAGVVGGGLGGQILSMVLAGGAAATGGGMDVGSILTQVAGGGVGGGLLMTVIGVIRSMMAK